MPEPGAAPPSAGDLPAEAVLERLAARGETLAVAESLTGGMVLASLTAVPGASRVVRGGVVAYATDVKATVLGVDPALLAAGGPVQADVALAMAAGVARVCGAAWGAATTGVAGPGPADGHPAGTVFVAVARPNGSDGRALQVPGLVERPAHGADRNTVRAETVRAVLDLAREVAGA